MVVLKPSFFSQYEEQNNAHCSNKYSANKKIKMAGSLKTCVMKNKLLPALIWALLSSYAVYAQVGKNSNVNTLSNNGNQYGHSWLLTGNSGTDSSKNFLGTRDAKPLLFRVNNQRSGYLDFNDFSQNTAFGYQTLIANVPSEIDGITGGIGNSAFGYQALRYNISGELNTAIGQQALSANTEFSIADIRGIPAGMTMMSASLKASLAPSSLGR